MSDWRPTSGADVARRRAGLLERARTYFAENDILAVDTPAFSNYASVDAHIASFSVHAGDAFAGHLHTSPEVRMKRLIAAGYPDIYSICRVFRAGESGAQHAFEFTMAEWYRLGFGLQQIVDDTIGFIAACLDLPRLAGNTTTVEYTDIVRAHAGIDPVDAPTAEIIDIATDDAKLREGLDRDAALDLIVSTLVVPQFAPERLTVVRHYPASQAALARPSKDDERVADRFEVYCGELELANGYVELTDPDRQAQRLGEHCDLSLIAALRSGLPECAGVSVGIERLQMVLDQADHIRDVMTFVPDY